MTSTRITASADDVIAIPHRIYGARLVSAAADATAILFDGTQAAGVNRLMLVVTETADHPAADSERFTNDGGLNMKAALGVTLTGVGAILYIYHE